MPKAIRSGRANGRQSEFLVDYMVSNSEFANEKLMSPQGAINATQQWTELSNRLNELGPDKTMEQWKKVL
uniref:Uncharacterized protein n=1 Tax=Timema bartmani TaxID=61472 RepID=A0A7R9I8C8_9NEOP|nr:unnamed protein product [Timema bartmani]